MEEPSWICQDKIVPPKEGDDQGSVVSNTLSENPLYYWNLEGKHY